MNVGTHRILDQDSNYLIDGVSVKLLSPAKSLSNRARIPPKSSTTSMMSVGQHATSQSTIETMLRRCFHNFSELSNSAPV